MVQYTQEQIRGLKANESIVQKHVFETLYAPMFRVCQRYIVAQDEAEDCLMKGFMKAFQQIEHFKFENEGSLFWWIRRIMINECLMSLRKNRNFKMILEEDIKEVYVDANVLEQMNAEDLNNLILRLPTGYRTVFSLFVIDGFSHAEIAEMIGITESTSRTQLAKSKYKLRQMLEQNDRAYGN